MSGEIKNPDSVGSTSESPSRWTLLKDKFREGRKRFRVKNDYLKSFFFSVCLLIAIIQIYVSWQHEDFIDQESVVKRPLLEIIVNLGKAPDTMTEEKAKRVTLGKRKVGAGQLNAGPRFERIQPISLSDNSRSVPAGSEVKGILKSGGANGMIKVVTTEALRVDGDELLPAGTTLMGQGASNDERLFVIFRRAITPDLNQTKIHAMAFDDNDRMLGLKGKKISNYAFQFAAGSGLLFLGGMADGMRGDNSSSPFEKKRTTARDAALNGVTVSTSDLSRDVMEGMRNQQSRVEVAHSTPLIIIFGDTDAKE